MKSTTAPRYRLPQADFSWLCWQLHDAAVEICSARGRSFRLTDATATHIRALASELIDGTHFGVLLMGAAGNGKTTMAYALRRVICSHISGTGRPSDFYATSAIELAKMSIKQPDMFETLRGAEMLLIDDLGQEPPETMLYGSRMRPLVDVLSYRYQRQLYTIVTTNLDANEISAQYDERIRDRFREMMFVQNYGNEPSFRK